MSTDPLRIALAGYHGRMGQEIRALAAPDPTVAIIAGIVRPGRDPGGAPGIPLVTALDDLFPDFAINVLIDFSTAAAALAHARAAARRGLPLVLGTTGLAPADLAELRALAAQIPIWYARNMSLGVAVLHEVLQRVAAELTAADYDVEIIESHHRHKVDAPSGTALALAESVRRGRTAGAITQGRAGPGARKVGEIGIQSLRGGGNSGEHTVIFASADEEIRLGHRALSRAAFAAGALRAARRIAGAAPGWHAPEGA